MLSSGSTIATPAPASKPASPRAPAWAAAFVAIAGALLLSAGATAPSLAAGALDMAALRKMVSGLGLVESGDGKTFIQVENQGSRNLTIDFMPDTDDTGVLVFAPLADVPGDKMAAMPGAKMLAYNNAHFAFFALGGDNDRTIYLQYRIPAAAVTPQSLRAATDVVLAEADETADLWNADQWTAGVPAGAAVSGTDTSAKAEATPFAVSNLMFTATDTDAFSAYQKRASNAFTPDEKMFTYVEIAGLTYKPDGDLFKSAVRISASVRASNGTMLLSDAKMGTITNDKHAKIKEFYAGLSMHVNGIAPGAYVLIYKFVDVESGATATTEQPFTIAAATAR